MADTKIEWATKVWNPVTGCTKVSEGCRNCYAEGIAKRFWGERKFSDVICHEDRLDQPSKWRKPQRIFVNSMSDLFHPDVPNSFIKDVLYIMEICPQHTFMILTKRPERMQEFIEDYCKPRIGSPIENLWLGVSVEDQKTAEDRIPFLVNTPAVVRFLSCEPLLDLVAVDVKNHSDLYNKIDWIIAGGESGPKARKMEAYWARELQTYCWDFDIPFFFKQWGEFNEAGERVGKKKAGNLLDGKQYQQFPKGK